MTSEKERLEELGRTVVQDRERLAETTKQLHDRLTPGQLFDEILRQGGEPARNAAVRLGETISKHPIPALLMGTALVWLALESRTGAAPKGADTSKS